jgi:phenylacetate-coenzyme A ligase PaaK-like adenylate-forming protein
MEGSGTDLDGAREAAFSRMLDLVWRGHPWYRERFRQQGLRRRDIRSLADLPRLPTTSKEEYAAKPEAFRLRPGALRDLTLAERTLWGVIYTAGSTQGIPAPFYDTNYDLAARIDQAREMAETLHLRPDDTVLNAFPVGAVSHQGFLTALFGPLAVGARVVAGLSGSPVTPFPIYRSTDEVVRLAAERRATVLWGITSYVRRLVARAEELGTDLSAVRLVFAAGEACPAGMRRDLEERLAGLGAVGVEIQNGYGFTEMQGPAIECRPGGPFHLPAPSRYAFEIVDPASGEPLPSGSLGRLLVTHLDRRGTVLLRYAPGDLAALADDTCPSCGRRGPRILAPPRRIDNLVKIRGTLVNPDAVIARLSELPGLDDFQLVARRASGAAAADGLEVRATGHGGLTLVEQIVMAVRDVCEVRPDVRVLAPAEFAKLIGPYKFRRFVDERAAEEESIRAGV